MSNKLKLSTKDESLRDILGNGKKYIVPKFQRDYSWEQEHLLELWEDIVELYQGTEEDYHYMGYLVLQQQSDLEYIVIDGQQRFTTFSVLILAAIKLLKEYDDTTRANILHETFIETKDISSLETSNKLSLNKNNDYTYQELLRGREVPSRGKPPTVKLMIASLNFFYAKLKKISIKNNVIDGTVISTFIEKISHKLLFTTIYLADELSAYKVFETLNARGVKLSSADLLKNYLFSLIDANNNIPQYALEHIETKWEKVGTSIKPKTYTEFMIAQWNAFHQKAKSTHLFRYIKQEITSKNEAEQYLDQLEDDSEIFGALFNHEHEIWKQHDNYKEISRRINFLNIFNISQPHSLLMSVYKNLPADFSKILDWIVILSIRYRVICKGSAKEQEDLYNKICLSIKNKHAQKEDIKQQLKKFMPSDEAFVEDFTNRKIATQLSNKKARYLLARIEEHTKDDRHRIDDESYSLEHILPQKITDAWEHFQQPEEYTNRIGNMTLLPIKTNNNLQGKPFNVKRETFAQSELELNKQLADYSEWNADAILNRQKELAQVAVKLWNIY